MVLLEELEDSGLRFDGYKQRVVLKRLPPLTADEFNSNSLALRQKAPWP